MLGKGKLKPCKKLKEVEKEFENELNESLPEETLKKPVTPPTKTKHKKLVHINDKKA